MTKLMETSTTPRDRRPWWLERPAPYDPAHPKKPGYVLCTFLKFRETTLSLYSTESFLGWFPPHKPRVRGQLNALTRAHFEGIDEMKRYNAEKQKTHGKWVPTVDDFVKARPSLDAFMTDAFWDDGKPRDPCSLTVRIGKGSAMVSLNDGENEQSISTNGKTVDDAIDALESYLATGNPSWRPWGKKRR